MARFRLRGKHYLPVPGTEWEYKETASNGKQKRMVLPVPAYLNPEDPSDHNYPGEIIVSTTESALYPKDIIFTGPPTPDMEPLDEEAEKLMQQFAPSWKHPIESLPGVGSMIPFGDRLLASLQQQVSELHSQVGASPDKTIAELKEQVERLTKMVMEKETPAVPIEVAATAPPAPTTSARR